MTKVEVVCGVGDPTVRRDMVERAIAVGGKFTSLVHPTASLTPRVRVGVGVVIAAGTIVTTNVTIGDHVHVNVGSTLSHDVVIKPFTTIAPGVHIAGNVTIETGAYLGIGSVVLERRTIGARALVGAGAVVNRDVDPDTTVVGVPAKAVGQHDPGSLTNAASG
jgi:sugar O-acyltransferase (sialic acid O-acetyltransferase NeuD family)